MSLLGSMRPQEVVQSRADHRSAGQLCTVWRTGLGSCASTKPASGNALHPSSPAQKCFSPLSPALQNPAAGYQQWWEVMETVGSLECAVNVIGKMVNKKGLLFSYHPNACHRTVRFPLPKMN